MFTVIPSRLVWASLICLTTLVSVERVSAEPIGLMERFALAKDREAVLAELIPGSENYYYFHCLHYQTSGQYDRAEAILRDWLAEHKGKENAAITAMLDRQRLLTYQESPQRTIDHFVRRMRIRLDHAAPATQGERRYPSQFDPKLLDTDRVVKEALQRNDAIKPLGMRHLAELFRAGKTAGVSINLRDFLNRVDGPYIDKLDQLVAKELNGRRANERKFGDVKAHGQLTLAEMGRVAKAVPAVADDNAFVTAMLRRMRPSNDLDPSQQEDVRQAYLESVEAYARQLPASYNSLKASSAYRLLESNLARGEHDRELFIRYLKLPRVSPIVPREWSRQASVKAKLTDNFMNMALLPPIGDEQPLVRRYLEHFLEDAEDSEMFAEYLQPDYLRRVFAETKLLYGVGPEERWYKLLSAGARQALRDSVELRLAPENPNRLASDDPSQLIVDVKNIDELVVRVYEINTDSYYRTHDRAVDTDIDLDGLIPTHEQKLSYKHPAVRRHRETLKLDEIEGRGVWIVDLVGKGLRARAIVQRGAIHHVDTISADGMVFTIIDENRKPIPTATMLVGSREFVADDDGRIVLPPVAENVSRSAIISDGKVATKIQFRHLRENYSLTAGMHIDRTQLQSRSSADLLIRPRLKMGTIPIDPKTMSDVSVRIEATDMEGLKSNRQIDDVKLTQNAELVVPFRVPDRLSNLTVTLSGKIDGLADGKERTLQVSRSWDVAGIRRTSQTQEAFLTRDGDDYVIEVRGRNGEAIRGATLAVQVTTDVRRSPVQQTLQCDDAGRVRLGKLGSATEIRYSVTGAPQHVRDLEFDKVRWPNVIHTVKDRGVRLALSSPIESATDHYRLLEMRGGSHHTDGSKRLKLKDGLLVIESLEPGDYELVERATNKRTKIVVVDGPAIDSVATGVVRHREISLSAPVGIASIERQDGDLKIRLSGNLDSARVHVYASRYFDSVTPLDQLALSSQRLSGRRISLPRCGYVSDLRLGDEYQYVLRRRYAKKYPGVMLPQPSVLLNPWETEETTNNSQTANEGAPPPPSARPGGADAADAEMAMEGRAQTAASSDYDFLAEAGVMIANLQPDEDGIVTISADQIAGMPLLQVVVGDQTTLLQRLVAQSLGDAETIDLRLAKALDAQKAFSFERAVMIASPDAPLDLNRLGSAQLQVYGSVGSLMKLYRTLVGDPRMAEFDSLGRWNTLDQDQKRSAYSRLASHELHLFLWAHDRGFFEETIQPYLENKKEKQFIDHWLLGNDLKEYATLWRYNQLNAAERVLLAMRLPSVRQTVRRELQELVASQEMENFEVVRKGIESALMDRLSESESGAMAMNFESDGMAMFGGMAPRGGAAALQKKKSESRSNASRYLREVEAKAKSSRFRGRMGGGGMGGRGAAFFRDLDSTKQWAESHWDRTRTVGGPSPTTLIAADPFWSDLAGEEPDSVSVSTNLLRPIGNRHAALVALAMCGLPLRSGEIGLPTESDESYKPEHAVAVVTKRLQTLEPAEEDGSVLIGQRFASLHSPRKSSSRQKISEPTEFLIGVPYRGQTVVSNPTAERRVVDVFWQLPAGTVPLAGSQTTDSKTLVLEPFAVQAIEYQFYFPSTGQFVHYPATVATEGTLIARGAEKAFRVVSQPSEDDTVTWEKIVKTGNADQLSKFLDDANLRELDWMLIAHRMSDQDIYRVVIDALGDARVMNELWAYSMKHRDDAAMKSYLSMRSDLVNRVGPVLQSPLLDVDPIARRKHELLEYAPLVRARIHPLRDENEILNPTFLRQYQSFVQMLGYSNEINDSEKLVLCYYLLLQNRIAEAITAFDQVDRQAIDTKLQYDYVDAYLALHQEQYKRSEQLARKYSGHPVQRWRIRFTQLLTQLNQRRDLHQSEQLVSVEKADANRPIEEGTGDLSVMDRETRQEAAADLQPEVVVRVEGKSLRVDHRRAKDVTINLYGVDLELLFSKAPFVREDLQRMAMVRPARTEQVKFDQPTGVGRYELDDNLSRQTLLVEVVAGASRSTALYYGGEITTYVSESFGQLQTTDASTHRPIATAYVKVYAKYPNGQVRFYKDGYTDSRGRFDYASVSASDAKGATRFAILVISDEKGATLHDVAPPK